nr:immunoglobulin light chain junction region [Macaca mulatta]MOW40668.1 immunoglobulin light chain junction region [Macaca mulatta]MOW40691.1 immunoglobulin light chain junction region [Macaca mulatta]MOW40797.1 immunoglobulin light chain junction region [Macaca mulatta]MOW40831.1 immunoglobulin light chain junction region [Macaca mulatta]
CMQLLEFPLTF